MSESTPSLPIKPFDQGGFTQGTGGTAGTHVIPFDQGGFATPFDQGGFAPSPGPAGFAPSGNAPPGSALLPIGVLLDPAVFNRRFPLVMGAKFPRRAWDPNLYAQTILAEFGATGWMGKLSLPPPPTDALEIGAEIATLLTLSAQRVSRAAEIQQQSIDSSVYWAAMLMMSQTSKPVTWDLMVTANTVGHMVAMHFKRHFARARPAQVYPAILPMLPTPGHPSYPNAHALENALIAACLELVVPPLGSPTETQSPLDVLAERIGVNREIAGLHYPSDTKAGRSLVPGIMALLTPCPLFQGIVEHAKKEWEGIHVVPFGVA